MENVFRLTHNREMTAAEREQFHMSPASPGAGRDRRATSALGIPPVTSPSASAEDHQPAKTRNVGSRVGEKPAS
jgi:hypothetical protein